MGVENYVENEVMTATPGKLVLMLYDGAIRFLKRLEGIELNKEIEKRNYNINKACAIISELQMTLNMAYEEISMPLFSLYNYMNQRLLEANLKSDYKNIQEVILLLSDLRESWQEVHKQELIETSAQQHSYGAEEGQDVSFSMAG